MMIFLFMNLWNYIYSDPSELIHGYSMKEMIWYIVVTEVLYMTLKGVRLCKEISKDVKSGSIAYKVNKPYSYILFNLSSHLGKIFLDNILYITLSLILGTIFIGNIPVNIFEGLIVLISCLLATIISILLITSIGFSLQPKLSTKTLSLRFGLIQVLYISSASLSFSLES